MIEAQLPLPILLALEHTINQTIREDSAACARLAKLDGLVFDIHLSQPNVRVFLTPTAQGVVLRRDFDGLPDSTISASTLGLWRASRPAQGMDALFAGDIRIEGDQDAAQALLRVFSDLDIDVFAKLAEHIGAAPAGLIERRVNTIKKHFSEWRRTRQIEQVDFLIYESQLLVDGHDVQQWMDGVDAARDHVDQLAARLKRLDARLIGMRS